MAENLLTKKQDVAQKRYCINCGKEVTKQSIRCNNCENERRRKNTPMLVDREELKKLIRTQSFTQIGKNFGVTDNAIRKWCDKYNLPRTKKEINSYTDEQWSKI